MRPGHRASRRPPRRTPTADETEPTGFDTLRIHAVYDSQEHHWAVSPPIYQTAAFDLYGATEENLLHFLPKFGIETRFAQTHDAAGYAELIDERTRAVFLESISNPNAEIVDLKAIAAVAHAHGVPVVVDNSVATPTCSVPSTTGPTSWCTRPPRGSPATAT